MKTLLILLFPILSMAQGGLYSIRQDKDQVLVTFHKSTSYSLVTTAMPEDGEFFTSVTRASLKEGSEFRVDYMMNFWLVNKSDTVSLLVMSSKDANHFPVVIINGVDQRTKKKIMPMLWAYNEIVPMVDQHYAEEIDPQ